MWEALHGQRPYSGRTMHELAANLRRGELAQPPTGRVPAWIRRVLSRGLMVDPALRWPTMDALLAALSRDPARAQRRWLAAGLGVVAIAGAGYGAAAYRGAQAELCGGAAEELTGVWDGPRRAAVERALRDTGVLYAEQAVRAIDEHLDAHAARWVATHTSSCAAHQRGHLSPQLFDRRMTCLRQRLRELAGTTAVLAQTTRETAAQAVDVARGLPAVALCEDDARLLAATELPEGPAVAAGRERLARLQALERSGRYDEALTGALPLVEEADGLDHLAYRAEVHLLVGKLYMHRLQREARGHFEQALQMGLEADAEALVAEALALLMFQICVVEVRPPEALALEPIGWGLLRRVGDPPGLAALLHNSVGCAQAQLGERERAIRSFSTGLALLEAHAPDDPLRWPMLHNLASQMTEVGQYARAAELVRASLVQLEAKLGRCHPVPAMMQFILGNSDAALGRTDAAIESFEAGIACTREAYPNYALFGIRDLGALYLSVGDAARARREVDRADELIVGRPESTGVAMEIDILRADVDVAEGRMAAARAGLEALRMRAIEVLGAKSDKLMMIDTRLGAIAHRAGDDEAALVHLQRADSKLGPGVMAVERGLFAFTTARVLRALGREPERVARLTEEALAGYRSAGAPYAGQVAAIEAWRASP